jgi:multisubunit Na+/H+ antiporter MnhC subunit
MFPIGLMMYAEKEMLKRIILVSIISFVIGLLVGHYV